jgi:Secretion system C-terminal sorting domain
MTARRVQIMKLLLPLSVCIHLLVLQGALSEALSQPKTYYVAVNGNDSNAGLSIDQPLAKLSTAVSKLTAGDTIYVRGGTYVSTAQITLSSNGIDSARRTCVLAYPGERPLLDFSSIGIPRVSGSADGIRVTGRYWNIKGMDVKGAPHNGIAINGGWYNIIEYCSVFENRNTGLQISNLGSYNRVVNCDSYSNRDSTSASSYDGNADGFSPKLDNGTYNYFYGCRSWQNSDDGWDGYVRPSAPVAGKDTMVTILENCWSFANGYLKSGVVGTGNGNGFKMGGGDKDLATQSISNADSLRHTMILKNCLAFDNKVRGFDQNNNRGSMTMLNCTSVRNGSNNFGIPGFIRTTSILTVENCISLGSSGVTLAGVPNPIVASNSWSAPFAGALASDFISVDTTGVRGPRKSDGSLPDLQFMHLKSTSPFIDAGTNVGLPYNGSRPDLGCFETAAITDVKASGAGVPSDFHLSQNFPNPFNPATKILFSVPLTGKATLKILNVLGQEVATLFAGIAEAGVGHQVRFNASGLASGIYFSRLEFDGNVQLKKMSLLK